MLFLGAFAISGNSIIMSLKLLQIQIFRASFFTGLSKNHTLVALIYEPSLIVILIVMHKWNLHWAQKGIVFACLFICQYVLYRTGILYIKQGWFFIVTILDLFGCYFWVVGIDYLLSKETEMYDSD